MNTVSAHCKYPNKILIKLFKTMKVYRYWENDRSYVEKVAEYTWKVLYDICCKRFSKIRNCLPAEIPNMCDGCLAKEWRQIMNSALTHSQLYATLETGWTSHLIFNSHGLNTKMKTEYLTLYHSKDIQKISYLYINIFSQSELGSQFILIICNTLYKALWLVSF